MTTTERRVECAASMTFCMFRELEAPTCLNLLFQTSSIGKRVNGADSNVCKSREGDHVVAGDQVESALVWTLTYLTTAPRS